MARSKIAWNICLAAKNAERARHNGRRLKTARRNPVARALRSPAARQRIVPSGCLYRRHPKYRGAVTATLE